MRRAGRRPEGISKEIVCRPRAGLTLFLLVRTARSRSYAPCHCRAVVAVAATRRSRIPQFSRRNKALIGDFPIAARTCGAMIFRSERVPPRFRRADSLETLLRYYPYGRATSAPAWGRSFSHFLTAKGDTAEEEGVSTCEFRHTCPHSGIIVRRTGLACQTAVPLSPLRL